MTQLATWKFILENLKSNVAIVLLYVVESTGSSPGRQGFLMAVNDLKQMKGSIGGGIMEQKLVDLAMNRISKIGKKLPVIKKQIHDKTVSSNQSGMICSGEQTVAMQKLSAYDIPVIDDIVKVLSENKSGALILTEKKISYQKKTPSTDFSFDKIDEEKFIYVEKLGFKNQLHIIGGGHCSVALSTIFSNLDFLITIYENRKELNTLKENNFAHKIIYVENYENLKIKSGKNVYIIIMTVGYRTDTVVLQNLIKNNYAYIGLLGSKFKTKKLMNELSEKGIDKQKLESVFAPVGLAIKSETPFEIAVSIAAQIIYIKNINDI